MKKTSIEIVIEKEPEPEDDGYFAYSPTLPGCVSNGRTIEETECNLREAIQLHVKSLRAHGDVVPQHENLVHVEELSVGFSTGVECPRYLGLVPMRFPWVGRSLGMALRTAQDHGTHIIHGTHVSAAYDQPVSQTERF